MEFEGRIIRVLPVRSGTSQNGNEWKRLPFVFAYYETPDQRWEDRVLLEANDTNQMAQIAKFCEVDANKKVIVENGSVKLKMLDIKCKCGFSHNVKDVTRKDGSGSVTINEMKCYKLEVIQQQMPSGNAAGAAAQQPAYQPQAQMPFGAPQQQGGGEDDDLPF